MEVLNLCDRMIFFCHELKFLNPETEHQWPTDSKISAC